MSDETMTKEAAAAALNGNEYGSEGTPELFAAMKAAGLVAVFGYSDDNAELRGAIHDEVGCYDGGTIRITATGLLKNECEDGCPYFAKLQAKAASIEAVWDKDGYSWVYRTEIPHATFDIMEDGETYCRGIVFALTESPTP